VKTKDLQYKLVMETSIGKPRINKKMKSQNKRKMRKKAKMLKSKFKNRQYSKS
jgi:hypothetical protein